MAHNRFAKLSIAVLAGLLFGIGGFTFQYAEGPSYFSTNPKACANCHIMQPQLDSWQKASHHTVALCVDCHLPHDFIEKYAAKAENGYYHSKGFVFQDFHEPIMIKPKNSRILQENCLRCHGELVHDLEFPFYRQDKAVDCVHCHRDVGHGETAGLGGSHKEFLTRIKRKILRGLAPHKILLPKRVEKTYLGFKRGEINHEGPI
ncbi:MAG: cytochrome c nitrite reductase small subunit [Deltaproteobacteria bacterium]|nr:cytochrome c nitrite reductase small subunit [Deltaproteobacteria bacterium]